MMRRARACLPLFAFVASLAAMACGGETIPPARESGASAPTATSATLAAEPTRTATPTAVLTATPSPSASPTPTPPTATATTATSTPEPTPEPPAIEYTPLTFGESRALRLQPQRARFLPRPSATSSANSWCSSARRPPPRAMAGDPARGPARGALGGPTTWAFEARCGGWARKLSWTDSRPQARAVRGADLWLWEHCRLATACSHLGP